VFSVASISAPRPAADWYRTTPGEQRSTDEARLPTDRVTLSSEARTQLRLVGQVQQGGDQSEGQSKGSGGQRQPGSRGDTSTAGSRGPGAGEARGAARGDATASSQRGQLTPEQQQRVTELRQRDTHVRAHEAAHQAAGGSLTGPASYTYELGPDGRSYAVGGEVSVQSRTGRTPDETIAIARQVRAAALAPGDPSSADLAAATAATQVELQALQQKRQQGATTGAAQPAAGQARAPVQAAQTTPVTTPRANLERLIVRSPEPEPFM